MAATVLVAVSGKAVGQAPASRSNSVRREQQSIGVKPETVRFNNYLQDLAGRNALIGIVGGGVLQHFQEKRTPWNEGSDGFQRVILSRAGEHAVNVSVRHGLAALLQRSTDDRYQPCDCHGLVPRVGHAIVATFTDQRADGSRAFSFPRVAGAYAGNFAQAAWEPGHSAGNVARATTLSFGVSALFNVGRELTGLGR
jgi:hypothetical protein